MDGFGSLDELLGLHGVGLVAWQEGNVDVFEFCHFGDVLGVAGDVDAQSVDGEQVAVVATFGVELEVAFGGVIGRYGLHFQVAELLFVAIVHDGACREHVGTALVGDKTGVWC